MIPDRFRLPAFVLSSLLAASCPAQDPVQDATQEIAAVGNPALEMEAEPLLRLDIDALYSPLVPELVYGPTAIELIDILQSRHYLPIEVDDDFSSLVFDKFLDALDGDHLYFLREDIDYLSAWRYNIDDHLREGSLTPGYEIYNLY